MPFSRAFCNTVETATSFSTLTAIHLLNRYPGFDDFILLGWIQIGQAIHSNSTPSSLAASSAPCCEAYEIGIALGFGHHSDDRLASVSSGLTVQANAGVAPQRTYQVPIASGYDQCAEQDEQRSVLRLASSSL